MMPQSEEPLISSDAIGGKHLMHFADDDWREKRLWSL